jgi:hypothetical protein
MTTVARRSRLGSFLLAGALAVVLLVGTGISYVLVHRTVGMRGLWTQ